MTASTHTSAAPGTLGVAFAALSRVRGRFAALGLSCALLGCGENGAVAGGRVSLAAGADDPAVFGTVGDFALVDQTGAAFTQAELVGKIWVLSNIYTTCSGPCPSVTRTVSELQERLADTDVRLISLSVDPELDTPEVLARYSELHAADSERWSFLTGTEEQVRELLIGRFFLPAERDAEAPFGAQVSHRTSLVVVDREGRLRGYYDSLDAGEVDLLEARVRGLAATP